MILQPKKGQVNESFCIIATGSNLSHRLKEDRSAISIAYGLLFGESVEIVKTSQLYRTPAFPKGAGPDYINAAWLCSTTLAPTELMSHLHDIEQKIGRTRNKRWESRVIDLDLIDYDGLNLPDRNVFDKWHNLPLEQQMVETPDRLILPHPRIQDRPFVLVPMRDIVPNWVHPITGLTLNQMLARFTVQELSEIQPIENGDSLS